MRMRCVSLALLCAACALAPALAQNYPDRPVRIVVGNLAGSGVDSAARVLAQKLSDLWPQQVAIDNRPGANGANAGRIVANSKPDGITLLMVNNTHAINSLFTPNQLYDALTSFDPITLVGQYSFLLVEHPGFPARSLKDLISFAKSRPGEVIYGSPGNGSASRIGMETFIKMAGVNMQRVVDGGPGPAIAKLMSGETHVMLLSYATAQSPLKAGRLRALVVAGPRRSMLLPEVPTSAESGMPGFSVRGWYALLAPAGLPAAIRTKVHDDAVKALRTEAVNKSFNDDNIEVVGGSAEELLAFLKSEIAQYAAQIKAAGIKPE